MTQLNQILAIEKGARANGERTTTEVYHQFQKPQLMTGVARTYRPKDEEGERLPGESTLVQLNAEVLLGEVAEALTRLFDVTATKDYSNCLAKADVVIDGDVILADVPVTYLLWLEKSLVNIHTLLRRLPALDPTEMWYRDETTDSWRTRGTETTRTKKVPRNHVKAPATDKHPAQVEVFSEDVVVGYWLTIKFSGAMPAQRINVLLSRATKLLDAVKMAREQANSIQVTDIRVGEKLFGYLLREGA